MTGPRAQNRIETMAQIMKLAREQISMRGASSLSLREIARDLGMASSALYRYFTSRDQLLTALIIESYDTLGELVETEDARHDRANLANRWRAITTAIRNWAITNPSDYGLLFGTPVPGYEAPSDTTIPGERYTNVLMELLVDAHNSGCVAQVKFPETKAALREYKNIRKNLGVVLPNELLLAGLTAWASVIGAISLEVFGHVDTVLSNSEVHFKTLTDMLGTQLLGLY